MLKIGCHLSISKGFLQMGKDAVKIGANTMQFFTRNPRGSKAKDIDPEDISAFLEFCKENGISHFLAHAPYTLNPCSANPETRIFAKETMEDDLKRLELLGGCMYNFHPGSHTGQGAETGIQQIADMLNSILTQEQTTVVLLETMAGKGSEIGRSFEELKAIIDKTELKDKIGVCLDTCHIHDGGYDIVTNLDGVIKEFDKVVGLSYLKAIHLNDSMNPLAAHKDRHEKIGKGYIGIDSFQKIINHPALCNLPFYLETPNELPGYQKEIETLKKLFTF
ncbi:MAG: deoxyribonuclease IV [Clostridia bacterium]|nr:deoxyribonuclease IV [Clostridia bacterium]